MPINTSTTPVLSWLKLLDLEESDVEVGLHTAEHGKNEIRVRILSGGKSLETIVWNPTTFKGVMDHALRLAAMVHRLPVLMSAIAEREARLRTLRSWIHAPVKQQNPGAPTSVCLYWEDDWRILGRWVPDLIDRAGGRPVLLDSGDDDMKADSRDLSRAELDVIFLGTATAGTDPIFITAVNELFEEVHVSGRAYIADMSAVIETGPALYDSVFLLAAGLNPEIEELESKRIELTLVYPPGTD
ncbi:MAG: hypothetical protein O7C39_04810 [Bacteroidetes bacterium]|nr:hypothetical protein [Bacteroidota bacterium]